jgi:hypothetical protein
MEVQLVPFFAASDLIWGKQQLCNCASDHGAAAVHCVQARVIENKQFNHKTIALTACSVCHSAVLLP